MLIVKKITKNVDGNYEVSWQLPEEQMSFLLTYAINNLVAEGLVSIEEVNELDSLTTEGGLQ